MEKLDKEALAIKYLNSISTYDTQSLINLGNKTTIGAVKTYKAGIEYAENHYLAKLEEKNKTIANVHDACDGLNDFIFKLTDKIASQDKELLQAKKLLKKAIKPLRALERDIINCQVEEFLKK